MKRAGNIGLTGPRATHSEQSKAHKTTAKNKSGNIGIQIEVPDVLDALPFYVMLIDDQHRIIYVNRAVQTHLGVHPEDVIGKYCPTVIHGQDKPWYACPLEEAVQKEQPAEREALDLKSGRWIRSVIYPTRRLTQDGRTIYFHMVIDITDRKQAEARAEAARVALETYAAHMVRVIEDERQRLARDLHDEVIQNLALLCRRLSSLQQGKNALSAEVNYELRETQGIAESTVASLRDFTRALRPAILDDLGIVPSIRRLLADVSERTGMKSDLKVVGEEKRLPMDTEVGLFRIAQEALWNVERHSKATQVVMTISFDRNSVGLEIDDNGVGFHFPSDLRNFSDIGRLGLLGMQERSKLLGGELRVASQSQKGTTIKVSLPVA